MFRDYVPCGKYVKCIHETMYRQVTNIYITLDGHRKLNIRPTEFLSNKNCDILTMCEADHVELSLHTCTSFTLQCFIWNMQVSMYNEAG